MTDHPTPGSPLSADDVGLLKLIEGLADRGHKTPGCENWRAVSMCRQISDIVARRLPTDRRAEAEGQSTVARPVEGAMVQSVSGGVRADKDAPTPPSAVPDAGLESAGHFYQTRPGSWCQLLSEDGSTTELVTRQSAAAALEAAAAERRNIVSHATMGATDGVGLSTNAVSVEITKQRNVFYDRATRAEAQVAALREALEKIKKVTATKTVGAAILLSEIQLHADQALSAIPTPEGKS